MPEARVSAVENATASSLPLSPRRARPARQETSMSHTELQRDVRAAIAMAYELSRHERIQNSVNVAAALADLEFELARIEAKLGGPKVAEAIPTGLDRLVAQVHRVIDDAGEVVG